MPLFSYFPWYSQLTCKDDSRLNSKMKGDVSKLNDLKHTLNSSIFLENLKYDLNSFEVKFQTFDSFTVR